MSVKGTRNLFGNEAAALFDIGTKLWMSIPDDFARFIPSTLASLETFKGKVGDNRMYEFKDKAGRDLVLIPEVTAIVREEYNSNWSKTLPKPVKLFYCTKVFRYDNPQRGRYREFTQFGIEVLGGNVDTRALLLSALARVKYTGFEIRDGVERGQDYYTGRGFEVWKDGLQIAGGGPYAEGEGWAIGLERLILTI